MITLTSPRTMLGTWIVELTVRKSVMDFGTSVLVKIPALAKSNGTVKRTNAAKMVRITVRLHLLCGARSCSAPS